MRDPKRARAVVAAVVAATVALALWTAWAPPPAAAKGATGTGTDFELYGAVRERLAAGEPYYDALGSELLARGFAQWPPFHWRFPTHLELLATLSWPGGSQVLFLALVGVAAAGVAYAARSVPALAATTATLVILGLAGFALPVPILFSETWAALGIAISAAGFLSGQPALRVGGGLFALCFRELAALWCLGATLRALARGERGEAAVWLVGGLLYLGAYALHVQSVIAHLPADPLVQGWVGWGGLPHMMRAVRWFALALVMPWLAAPLVGANALAAIFPPEDRPEVRPIALLVLAYLAAFCVLGNPFNDYWGTLLAGLWGITVPYGLIGAWQAVRR
jgi:hypothetical protein